MDLFHGGLDSQGSWFFIEDNLPPLYLVRVQRGIYCSGTNNVCWLMGAGEPTHRQVLSL